MSHESDADTTDRAIEQRSREIMDDLLEYLKEVTEGRPDADTTVPAFKYLVDRIAALELVAEANTHLTVGLVKSLPPLDNRIIPAPHTGLKRRRSRRR